jgi:hypothetical protein
MMIKRSVVVAGVMGSALLSLTDVARAAAPEPVSDACHHYLPNGADIHHPSGEVYLDGKLIAVYPDADCTDGAGTQDNWMAWVNGHASDSYGSNLQDPAEYVASYEHWYVPDWPITPGDINYELLFSGIGGNGVLLPS